MLSAPPLTAIAVTKLDRRFLNRKHFETTKAHRYDTKVWMMKIKGMMARSVNFSAVSCDPSFVKTIEIYPSIIAQSRSLEIGHILRQGVNKVTLRLATSFWASASNMPCLAAK